MSTAVAQGWDVFSCVNGSPAGKRIIVCGDEWVHNDQGFVLDSASHTLFTEQCATWLTGKTTGAGFGRGFLQSSTSFQTALTDAGHTISSQETMSADYATQLALLETYEAWFVHPRDSAELGNQTAWQDWISAGGRVMFYAGNFSAHTQINKVIASFNLDLAGADVCNVVNELTDYSGHGHDILTGVGDLYFLGGKEVSELVGSAQTEIFTGTHPTSGSVDILATYDGEI